MTPPKTPPDPSRQTGIVTPCANPAPESDSRRAGLVRLTRLLVGSPLAQRLATSVAGPRATALTSLGGISVGTLSGCAAPTDTQVVPAPAFSFRDGAGYSLRGPMMDRLADPLGRFPVAWRNNWWLPSHSVDAFSRLDEIFSSAKSPRGETPRALARAPGEPAIVWNGSRALGGVRLSIDDYLSRNPVTGLLIARAGTVLVERYQYARNEHHHLTSFSMAKTLIALLVGCALEDGLLRTLDDPAERYAPGLSGSEYGRTPLRHLLTMSSGIKFREDYDGDDDSARLSRATLRGQAANSSAAATQFNQRIAAPGERWYYSSADTYALTLALRGALAEPIARYFSRRIWQPLGAQADAQWLTDPSGQELGYMGFSASLRDYARLGMMLAQGGTVDGRPIVDRAWIGEMTRMHVQPRQTGRWYGYGYQTWIFPNGTAGFALLGVRGQAMMIDPSSQTVMVNTAVRPLARDPAGAETVALWQSLTRGL